MVHRYHYYILREVCVTLVSQYLARLSFALLVHLKPLFTLCTNFSAKYTFAVDDS